MTLQQLLDAAIQQNHLTPTRVGPMRTAVTHYAAMLGVDPAACLPEMYDLSDHHLTALMQAQGPEDWTRHTRSTFTNGRKQGWLASRDTVVKSWRGHRDGPREG